MCSPTASAQLVHLEAARLLIQRNTDLEADRDQLLERWRRAGDGP